MDSVTHCDRLAVETGRGAQASLPVRTADQRWACLPHPEAPPGGGAGAPGWRGETNRPALALPASCFIDEHVTRVAWLNRSNILYAGNDRWTSDPRVRLLTNTPEEFSILITQVGLGDEGLYTCSFQTRRQPYTTQVYLIVHGEPAPGPQDPGSGGGDPRVLADPRGTTVGQAGTRPALTDSGQAEGGRHEPSLGQDSAVAGSALLLGGFFLPAF